MGFAALPGRAARTCRSLACLRSMRNLECGRASYRRGIEQGGSFSAALQGLRHKRDALLWLTQQGHLAHGVSDIHRRDARATSAARGAFSAAQWGGCHEPL